jgi:hypothetical protein
MTDSAGKHLGWFPPQAVKHECVYETFKHVDPYNLPPVKLPYVGKVRAILHRLRLRFFPWELRRIDQ